MGIRWLGPRGLSAAALGFLSLLLVAGCAAPPDLGRGSNADPPASPAATERPLSRLDVRALKEGNESTPVAEVTVRAVPLEPGIEPGLGVTDAHGTASLTVAASTRVRVEVTASEAWLSPPPPTLTTAPPGGRADVTVSLLESRKEVAWDLRWDTPAGVSLAKYGGPGGVEWKPRSHFFAQDEGLEKEYMAKVVYADLGLRWENTPAGFGDFGVALGRDARTVAHFENRGDQGPNDGPVEERIVLTAYQLVQAGIREPQLVWAGPATDAPLFAPTGLVVHVTLVAEFANVENGAIGETPGPGLALAGAAAGCAAVWMRRRRRGPSPPQA